MPAIVLLIVDQSWRVDLHPQFHRFLLETVDLQSRVWDFGHWPLEVKGRSMLGNMIELLGALCVAALTLLMSVCIVGSAVAALRAINRGSVIADTRK